MPNPWTDSSRDDRWEVGLSELNMDQLRAPSCLRWLKQEGKPADATLGTFALTSMFNDVLHAHISARKYAEVIRLIVRAWPELLTAVRAELTPVIAPDGRQAKPPAKAAAR